MRDNQYQLFRDIDRRCVAGGLKTDECTEAVRLKRASIESDRFRNIPLVQAVLEGSTTFVEAYDSYSRAFRGIRRFAPHPHDHEWNARLEQLASVVPNVRHFVSRSLFALDNPVTCTIYGLIAAAGIALVLAHASRGDDDAADALETANRTDAIASADAVTDQSFVVLFVLCGIVGFMAGVFAMLKYRTRDSSMIHAREAAAYMDLNYGYYRIGDDRAWAQFIHLQGSAGRPLGGAREDPNE